MNACLIGVAMALSVALFAKFVGLDRDRAFYATVMAVIALLYNLFAVMGGSHRALALEIVGSAVFLLAVAIGFRRNLWIVAGALAAHGVYDFIHPHLFANPGVPAWWPMFCSAYDIAAAGCLARLLTRRHERLHA